MIKPLQVKRENFIPAKNPSKRWVFLYLLITGIMLAEAAGFVNSEASQPKRDFGKAYQNGSPNPATLQAGHIHLFTTQLPKNNKAGLSWVEDAEKIVNAIYLAEGGAKTRFPYGIKSINTHGNKEYARRICLNSVRNGRARFIKQIKYTDFIEFLGLRYCPPTAHKLNQSWVSNVKFYLAKGEGR